jgi:hypothetical protein
MKTLITWPEGAADGEREGRAMHATYPMGANWIRGEHLEYAHDTGIELLIVLGPAEAIRTAAMLDAIANTIRRLEIKYATLAECGGTPATAPALDAAAQQVADATGADVLASQRALHREEASALKAFAGSEHGFSPINPDGDARLWKEFRRGERAEEPATPSSHA